MLAGLALAVLVACSGPAEPVTGLGGLAFGDPRPAACAAVDIPLPHALAESLAYCTLQGRGGQYLGAALHDPVYGFYQGRFFTVSAGLDSREAAEALRRDLTRGHGPPYCRETPGLAVCLWRAGEADVVLETPADGPPRLVLRHRPTAARLAAAGDPADRAGRETPGSAEDAALAP
ncbi:MAG: hypothetical protein ACP59X_09480 [Solidesulfovibrio sp. DCME]|uniref:hypothetical protein n=1 Tax=Solidesulfovibrio sp. DCME TaxID=3447380 RepID=UPI003D107A0C